MKKLMIIAIACSVLYLSGCGTFVRMGAGKEDDRRFAATRIDICVLREAWSEKCENSAGYFIGWKILTLPAVIDFPFALALDTLLIPFDAYSYSDTRFKNTDRQQQITAGKKENPVANQRDAPDQERVR